MTRRHLILYGLLLLIPGLVLGIGGFVLLRHEAERWQQREAQAAEAEARLVADRVVFFTLQLEDEVARCVEPVRQVARTPVRVPLTHMQMQPQRQAMSQVSQGAWLSPRMLADRAMAMAISIDQSNLPLARQVFFWRKPNILMYPDPVNPATGEQGRFVRRFALLFSGQAPWDTPAADPATKPAGGAGTTSSLVQRLEQVPNVEPGQPPLNWVPWYADNQLHLLGWCHVEGTDGVVGVELEMMAFLSRLLPMLSGVQSLPDTGYALVDGAGNVVYRSGEPVPDSAVLGSTPVGEVLPHWRIDVYPTRAHGGVAPWLTAASFGLLGLMVAAIVIGGGVIAYQAQRDRADAERKTTFVSNVSHELKTPLTTIRMYAEMLAEERVKEEKRPRYLQTIVDESQRLTRLVNNVLDFSRLEQGRKNYHPERLDVGRLAEQVTETMQPRLEAAGMRLELAAEQTPAEVICDRDALEQVLLNLVDNAVKYAAAGGEVRIEVGRQGGEAVVTVSDQGPGIPKAHWGRIFQAFHRVDDSLTAASGGTGLGLSISRRLLRDLGGELTYEPNEPAGARFVVRLPAAGGQADG